MTRYLQDIDEVSSPAVRRLTDACGAEGYGAWSAAKCELYKAAVSGDSLTLAELSRAVSSDCCISRGKARKLLVLCRDFGLFSEKNGENGKLVSYEVEDGVRRYNEVSERRKRAAGRRYWNENLKAKGYSGDDAIA